MKNSTSGLWIFLLGMLVGALILVAGILGGSGNVHAQTVGFDSNLYYGLTNNLDVQALQEFLITQGDLNYPPTGNFYSLTLQGVKEFQAANNLPITGYFGVLSRGVANGILSASIVSPPDSEVGTSTGNDTSTTTPALPTFNGEATTSQTFAPTENQPLFVTPQGAIINANGDPVTIPAPQTVTPPVTVGENSSGSVSVPTPSCVISATNITPSYVALSWTVVGASAKNITDPDYTVSGGQPISPGGSHSAISQTGGGYFPPWFMYSGGATTTTYILTVVGGSQQATCSVTVSEPQS